MTFTIAPAIAHDASALARLHAACFVKSWAEKSLATLIADPLAVAFIARNPSHDAAGMVLARSAAGESEILTLAVAPQFRRCGIAAALMAHAMTALAARGADSLFLEVSEAEEPARALYARLGFEEIGRRKGYYEEDGSDAILMRRDLHLAP